MIKNINTQYTKELRDKSWLRGALRNGGDVAHNVVFVVLGNALVVAPAKLVQHTFDLEGGLKWIKPLHRQRMDARRQLDKEPHYAAHKDLEANAARRAAKELKERTKPLEQKRVEAEARVFDRVASAWSNGKTQGSAVLNQCAIAGLREMLDAGTITQDEFNNAQVDGQPGIFPAKLGRPHAVQSRLPAYGYNDKFHACKAAIARHCMASGLVTKTMLDEANYPKDEHGAYLFSDLDQAQFEISSSSSSSSEES